MKLAIIRAHLGTSQKDCEPQGRGCGRSQKRAASRALLNLLRDRRLRRHKTLAISLELIVMNMPREPDHNIT